MKEKRKQERRKKKEDTFLSEKDLIDNADLMWHRDGRPGDRKRIIS